MDTRKRSWVKSLTWRSFGIALLGLISLLITKDWKQMTVITVLFHGIRLILYYYHERIWERVSWGKVKHPLEELMSSVRDFTRVKGKRVTFEYVLLDGINNRRTDTYQLAKLLSVGALHRPGTGFSWPGISHLEATSFW